MKINRQEPPRFIGAGSITLLLLFAIAGAAFAYTIPSHGLLSASGSISSASYQSFSGVQATSGTAASASYSTNMGLVFTIPALTPVPTPTPTPTPSIDTTPPVISSFQFDGTTIVANDYVKGGAAITADITDASSLIDLAASSIALDSQSTAFSALANTSSYVSTDGKLTYKLPALSDGEHTFAVTAQDSSGNLAIRSVIFNVSAAGASIAGEVLNYPNPFNPGTGATEIGYQLTQDSQIDIYIYSVLGQRIWKRSYAAGVEGGKAGYNKVSWDGWSDFNVMVANDIYLCRIISNGKVIGKCKIAVLK